MKKTFFIQLFIILMIWICAAFSSSGTNIINIANEKPLITSVKTFDCHYDTVKTDGLIIQNKTESINKKSDNHNSIDLSGCEPRNYLILKPIFNITPKSVCSGVKINLISCANYPRAP